MPLADLDAFRLELGDTDATDQLFSDTEAQYYLDKNPGSVLLAVADACEALARRFSRKVDTSIKSGEDSVSRKYGSMAETYATRAAELRQRATASTGAPWHGGGSQSRKDDLASDTDRVQPRFSRGAFDSPGVG